MTLTRDIETYISASTYVDLCNGKFRFDHPILEKSSTAFQSNYYYFHLKTYILRQFLLVPIAANLFFNLCLEKKALIEV